ncbi:MAG TPA: SLC13 family permease [Planctomycetaceae bacterium]|nr:SLC13 family permease [Planctomycetaceae bacterium]
MDLAWISLAALFAVIIISCTTSVNPGVLSVALAWMIGVYLAPACGYDLGIRDVVAGFPADLFLTLVGVTLLFTQAQVNGTLDKVSQLAVRCCRGNVGLIPVMFFLLAFGLSAVGAGNIAAAALMAPMAMAVAERAGISAFLMTVMVAHGTLAGALSPFAPTGIIANNLMRDKMGLSGVEAATFGYNLLAHVLVAFGGYLLLGGWRLFSRSFTDREPIRPVIDVANPSAATSDDRSTSNGKAADMRPRQWLTLCVVGVLIVGVVFGQWNVGMAAFAGAAVLTLARAADESQAVRNMPWSVIVMVCGVTVLTSLLEKTGGIDRFAEIIARVSSPRTVTPVIAALTGIVSVYSSTSGVVLPAFLPMVPKLVVQLGGGDSRNIALSVIVGGHLVDSSPLSTIGALCIASAPVTADRRLLFNKVMIWGLSMTLVGAGLCYLLFGRI